MTSETGYTATPQHQPERPTETGYTATPQHQPERPTPAVKPSRLWLPIALVCLFWAVYCVGRWTEFGVGLGFMGFLIQLATVALVTLVFVGWWLFSRTMRLGDRLFVFGAAVLVGIGAAFLSDRGLIIFLLLLGLPLVLTAWTLGLLATRNQAPRTRCIVLVAAICLIWAAFPFFRMDGLGGDFQPTLHWRWQPSGEDLYKAELKQKGETAAPVLPELASLRPGDWPGFRGPNRDGELNGVRLATDWNAAPPRLVWKRRIGPAWSSMAVVGDRLFTQEEVGDSENVVCLDAATGGTAWSHRDAARHDEKQSGPGPRATPTFADGRLFALGATGILNCLDAVSGERKWSRDIAAEAGAKKPIWGFSSSPLVVGGLVIVFAEGESDKTNTLLAYKTDSGKPAWTAPAGKLSYSSPQLASIDGVTQILFDSDQGLTAFDPTSGAVLWKQPTPPAGPGLPQSVQPQVIGKSAVLFDAGANTGLTRIDLSHENQSWTPTERWVSRQMKPAFNDFVVHDNALYGFDGRILSCIDLETGQRRWKEGRYGSGQVLLLADQPLLLVLTDAGEVVLVAANPDRHQELGRFQAIEGKTWNHPVIAHGRLYVRNADEMACYDLRLDEAR
jgi:outer membrane protein assembly factor BamB